MESHPRLIRLFFWFLLAVFSTFFAEVTVGSAPLVFFKPDGWLLTVPVYGLHILVLAPLVIRLGRVPAWQSLYLMGTIFGLYEAYMTKILWSPTWNPTALSLGGVAIAETLLLVFFWHPVMAFLVPLVFTEHFLNLQPAVLPALGKNWVVRLSSRRFYLLIGALAGLVLGTILGDPSLAIPATMGTCAFLFLLIFFWNRFNKGASLKWHNLLPYGLSWKVFTFFLLLDFLILGILIRPESIPSVDKQLTIWVMYAILGWLTWQAVKHQPVDKSSIVVSPSDSTIPGTDPLRLFAAFATPFCLTAVVASMTLASFKNYAFLAVSILGIAFGLVLLIKSIRWTFTKFSE